MRTCSQSKSCKRSRKNISRPRGSYAGAACLFPVPELKQLIRLDAKRVGEIEGSVSIVGVELSKK